MPRHTSCTLRLSVYVDRDPLQACPTMMRLGRGHPSSCTHRQHVGCLPQLPPLLLSRVLRLQPPAPPVCQPPQARLPEIEELQKQLTATQAEATEAAFKAQEEAGVAAAREKCLAGGRQGGRGAHWGLGAREGVTLARGPGTAVGLLLANAQSRRTE